MLKTIFIDIFPFIIDKTKIYELVWKKVLGDKYDKFLSSETLNKFISLDLKKSNVMNEFIEAYDNEEEAKKIIDEYVETKVRCTKQYFQDFEFPEFFIRLAEDAKTKDCSVVITNDNEYYSNVIKTLKLPENVYIYDEKHVDNVCDIEEKLAKNNISIDEFIYISNNKDKIEQLVEKGFFCVKISARDSQTSDVTVLGSIDDLTFGNLAFKFYDWTNNQGGL